MSCIFEMNFSEIFPFSTLMEFGSWNIDSSRHRIRGILPDGQYNFSRECTQINENIGRSLPREYNPREYNSREYNSRSSEHQQSARYDPHKKF